MDYNEYQKNKSITYVINNLDDLQSYIDKDIEQGSGPIYVMLTSRLGEYNKELITDVSKLTEKLFKLGFSPKVSFNIGELDIGDDELENIVDYGADLQLRGGDIGFNQSLLTEYSVDEVVDAQIKASGFIKSIKELNASPLEKVIMVQNYVTSWAYQDDEQEPDNSRDLIKVLNGQDIVCVGYASMMTYLLGALGIKCVSQNCEVVDRKTKDFVGYHVNNVVCLKDDKYGVDGWYYLDACWDCKNQNEEPFMRYNYCLIPFGDVKKIRRREIEVTTSFCSALYSEQEQEEMYQNIINFSTVAERVAKASALEQEFDDMYEFLDAQDEKMQERRTRACQRLRAIMKNAGVGTDFFKAETVPIESSFCVMLANLMQEPVDEDLMQKSIEGLKLYNQLLANKEAKKTDFTYIMAEPLLVDVDKFLEVFEKGNVEDVDNSDCLILVEEKLRDLRFAKFINDVVNRAKKSSKPIPLPTYQRVIENANLLQGMPEALAKVQAQRAIDYSVKLSERAFKADAENCFRQEALRRREEQDNNK